MAQTDAWVAYYRVSTVKQGASGLGLEAQRSAVMGFLNGGDWKLIAEFTEVESGKDNARPQLQAAIERCRLTGARLLISKLDRLSRDTHFLLGLEKTGIEFTAADMPSANRLTVRLMAVIAEEERHMISARTKAALQAAKERGIKLGGFRGHKVDGKLGAAARATKADEFAARVLPVVLPLKERGASLNEIVRALEAQQIRTPSGGTQWSAVAVSRILKRQAN